MRDVYRIMRTRILSSVYKPGTVLNVRSLAEELGVSPTPVREAIIRLEAEGFIKRTPNSAAVVSEASFRDLRNAFELRLFLMDLVGRLASQRVTNDQLEEMEEVLERLRAAREHTKVVELDEEFHRLVNQATGNEDLCRTLDVLRTKLRHVWLYECGVEDSRSHARRIENLERIIAALRNRDGKTAASELKEHVRGFVEQVSRALLSISSLGLSNNGSGGGQSGDVSRKGKVQRDPSRRALPKNKSS